MKRALPGLLFALLVIGVYADPLFFRRNFMGRDLGAYNLPMEKAVHDAYARGRLPTWLPEISGGRPLLPNPNVGALYPVRPLLATVPFPVAMRVFPILHWVAAGLGMMILLRSLGVSSAGAWVAAVTYVFSGVGVSEVFFTHIHPGMALLPWILWAIRRDPASRSGKILLVSFLYGLLFLAGDVFTSGIAIAASVLWILVEVEQRKQPQELLSLAASLALAALLAAPQILATALWVPETNRAVLGMKLWESLFFSIHPLRLVELVIPFPYGAVWELDNSSIWGFPVFHYKGMGIFQSLYAGAFAVFALVATRKAKGRGFRFGRLLFLLALFVSVPTSLLPKIWEKLSSPLPLRNPEKFAVALVFALALVAGLALDYLREESRRRRWPIGVAVLLTALALGAAVAPELTGRAGVAISGDDRHVKVASEQLPGALADGALLWIVTVVAIDRLLSSSRSGLPAALALLTVVPIAANRRIARTLTEIEVFSPTLFARKLQRWDPAGAFRTLGESLYLEPTRTPNAAGDPVFPEAIRRVWLTHAHVLWNRGTVFNNDFDVGDFSRVQTLRRASAIAAGYTDSQAFFASLALRWGARFRDQKPIAGYRRFGGDLREDWDVLEEAEPDIRLARSWVEEAGGLDAIGSLPRLKSGEIVVETGRRARGSARAGIVHVRVREPERLVIETVTTDPTWLFVLRGFWNHRTVLLDGREVEYVPAQIAFSAVSVPPGRHRVEWTERVPGGSSSRWGPIAWAVFAAVLAVRSRQKGRSE